jgi:hypothetical protein
LSAVFDDPVPRSSASWLLLSSEVVVDVEGADEEEDKLRAASRALSPLSLEVAPAELLVPLSPPPPPW